MENTKFSLEKVIKFGLVGLISSQTLYPMRAEAQSVAVSTINNKNMLTASFKKIPNLDCIQTAQHTASIFTKGADLMNNITFDPKKQQELTATSIIGKNPFASYAENSDLAIICRDKSNFRLYQQKILHRLNTENQFNRLIEKDPRIKLETAVIAKLSGRSKDGNQTEITPTQAKLPKFRKITATHSGQHTTQTNTHLGCVLNFSERDLTRLVGKDQVGSIYFPLAKFVLFKKGDYYQKRFKNKNLPLIPAMPGGSSGSPISSTNEKIKFGGTVSASVEDKTAAETFMKLISQTRNGKRSIQQCSNLGFNLQNSELGQIGVVFRDSKFTILPKYTTKQYLDFMNDNPKP